MDHEFIAAMGKYYGLDWFGFCAGVSGMFLVTQKCRWGFLLSSLTALCGMIVASMGGQYGYVLYNVVLFCLMLRGYISWSRPQAAVIADQTALSQPAQSFAPAYLSSKIKIIPVDHIVICHASSETIH